MLVTDHSASNEQAEKVAKQIGITVPTELSVIQKVTYNRMSKLSGTAFDRAFVAEMIAGHKTNITRFQNEEKGRSCGRLRQSDAPTLKKHLDAAQQLEPGI